MYCSSSSTRYPDILLSLAVSKLPDLSEANIEGLLEKLGNRNCYGEDRANIFNILLEVGQKIGITKLEEKYKKLDGLTLYIVEQPGLAACVDILRLKGKEHLEDSLTKGIIQCVTCHPKELQNHLKAYYKTGRTSDYLQKVGDRIVFTDTCIFRQ